MAYAHMLLRNVHSYQTDFRTETSCAMYVVLLLSMYYNSSINHNCMGMFHPLFCSLHTISSSACGEPLLHMYIEYAALYWSLRWGDRDLSRNAVNHRMFLYAYTYLDWSLCNSVAVDNFLSKQNIFQTVAHVHLLFRFSRVISYVHVHIPTTF